MCQTISHLKCNDLNYVDGLYLKNSNISWYCRAYCADIFPFTNINHYKLYPSINIYLSINNKLSFTNIRGLRSNFVDCESFLESSSPDVLALCETNLDDSIDSGNFPVRGFLPLIRNDSSTHMHGLAVYVKVGPPSARDLSLENSTDSYLCFRLALLHSVSYFFFLYRSPPSSLCMVFDSISSNMDKILSIKPSANVFAFGDSNVHHKDWLTYSGGTDRPGELCYNFSISNDLTQTVNFPTWIADCDSHSPALLDLFLSSDASIRTNTCVRRKK